MLNEIILAVLQAATEFLPISSSGHLALVSGLISSPDLFFFTALHIASLLAVLIFLRKEIFQLLSFRSEYNQLWIYLIIATIPAALFGYFFSDFIEGVFSNFLYIGVAFIFTGVILLLTKLDFSKNQLNWKNSLFIGILQVFALFPGVSRSGMTISAGLISGIERRKAIKFSFLLFIPLAVGAFVVESGSFFFSWSLLVSFIVCFILSYVFLLMVYKIVVKNYFWMFSIYCFVVGVVVVWVGVVG